MNKMKTFAPWLLAATALVSVASPVMAQDFGPRDQRGPDSDHRDDRRGDSRDDDRGPRRDDRRGDDRRDARDDGRRDDGRREWRRGDRYEGPRYVVDDYRRYDLPPPPDGRHRWIRNGDGDFILVAIATGVITDLLLGGRGR